MLQAPARPLAAIVATGTAAASWATALTVAFGPAGPVRAVVLALWILTVPGLIVLPVASVPRVLRLGLVPLVGLSGIGLVATVSLWVGVWDPRVWTLLILVVLAVVATARAWNLRAGWSRASWPSLPGRPGPWWWVWAAAVVLWVAGVPALRGASDPGGGLPWVRPPTTAVALVVAVVLFAVAVRQERTLRSWVTRSTCRPRSAAVLSAISTESSPPQSSTRTIWSGGRVCVARTVIASATNPSTRNTGTTTPMVWCMDLSTGVRVEVRLTSVLPDEEWSRWW